MSDIFTVIGNKKEKESRNQHTTDVFGTRLKFGEVVNTLLGRLTHERGLDTVRRRRAVLTQLSVFPFLVLVGYRNSDTRPTRDEVRGRRRRVFVSSPLPWVRNRVADRVVHMSGLHRSPRSESQS